MDKYNVTGMSCSACSARVEKAVSKVDGVSTCQVNLLTNSMMVDGTASRDDIISAVEKAGYGASPADGGAQTKSTDKTSGGGQSESDAALSKMKIRLVASVIILIPLMYISMGHMMWNWPLPSFFDGNHVAMGLTQMLLTILVMIINQKFFVSGFKGAIHGAPNMDTLVAMGSGASFIYSVYVLFAMTAAQTAGDDAQVMTLMHDIYFESAAMILALITVGKTLEAYSKGRTTDALKGLMDLAPKTAVLIRDGAEVAVGIDEVAVGDIFVVKPGESIPVDGIVLDGDSAVDESTLSGESIPVDKSKGSRVSAATINQSGYLKCRATQVGSDTALSKIINMVSDAAASKAPIAKIADKVSGVFVPVVIAIAVVTMIVWLIAGKEVGYALARGISVLVISCPCALGLATPVAIMVGNGMGAKHGILFKTATALEETGKTGIVVLDKTGTITKGTPVVTDIIPAEGITNERLIMLAAALEGKSEHPLAKAIVDEWNDNPAYSDARETKDISVTQFRAAPGHGLSGVVDGMVMVGGNREYISESATIPDEMDVQADMLAEHGKTPMFFAGKPESGNGKVLGIIAVADVVKEESRKAVEEMQKMGLSIVMLTGDNERTAKAIGAQVGVDRVIAGVLPDGKEKVVSELMDDANVIMVGDGINDAPALTRANIGIAIGAGTDIAIDAADIVLVKSSLLDVPAAIRLSMAAMRNIKENLFWAFIYNIIGIPLAAGVWIPIFGWTLNPMFGAFAMSLSSFCVVTNALRLNLADIYDKNNRYRIKEKYRSGSVGVKDEGSGRKGNDSDNTENNYIIENNHRIENEKGNDDMKKTMKIEGMMCGHCEARVKKCLEALPQVDLAEVSHEKGIAIVTLNADVDDAVLTKAVEDQDYKVISVQ